MPGLYGYTKVPGASIDLQSMGMMLCHSRRQSPDIEFEDKCVAAGRIPVNETYARDQVAEINGVYAWLDGEILNGREMGRSGDERQDSAKLLAGIFSRNRSTDLARLNGYFSAVVYDSNTRQVHLVSDRFGLRHLFYCIHKGRFVWCSEQKGFLAISGFDASLKQESLKEFLEWNYLRTSATWFNGVCFIEPASVTTFSIDKCEVSSRRYWDWRQIEPVSVQPRNGEIVDRIHEALQAAVDTSIEAGGDLVLLLSGGLDSRFIFAASPLTPPNKEYWDCITFGEKGCEDFRIAKKVAKLKPAKHHCLHLRHDDSGSFIKARLPAVWWLDGMTSVLDIWYNDERLQMSSGFSVNLNGFVGGAFFDGQYLPLGSKSMFEMVENRGRKMVATGSRLLLAMGIEQRKPFMDNRFIDYIATIDHRRLARSELYNQMLLKYYPEFYKSIPWQKSGLLINATPLRKRIARMKKRRMKPIKMSFSKMCCRLGIEYLARSRKYMADYFVWVNKPNNKKYIHELLTARETEVCNYIERKELVSNVDDYLGDPRKTWRLLSLVTIEIWLRHIKGKRV